MLETAEDTKRAKPAFCSHESHHSANKYITRQKKKTVKQHIVEHVLPKFQGTGDFPAE